MKNLILNIKSLIFSTKCIGCSVELKSDDLFCDECKNIFNIELKLTKQENIYYCYYYKGLFKKLLIDFKINGRVKSGYYIADRIKDYLFDVVFKEDIDLIIPVPINIKRKNSRGFNQVEELLNYLNYDYKLAKRIKNTKKMYKIKNKAERMENINNSFRIDGDIKGKNVMIFEDIITTGATINEFIKELKKYSPNKITIFSLSVSKTYRKILAEGRG